VIMNGEDINQLPPSLNKKRETILPLINQIELKKTELATDKRSKANAQKRLKGQIAWEEEAHKTDAALKKEASTLMKEIWIPNKHQLSKKTRAQTRQNVHKMSRLLSMRGLPAKGRKALDWLVKVQSQHLHHFQNPFSWHEFTGKVERPESPIPFPP
jgi:hypothetical protein